MAHFAQLDAANLVVQVIVVSNNEIGNLDFPQSEPLGVAFCQSLFGADTNWIQTSYNSNFRFHYAGMGYSFNPDVAPYGAFVPPQPFPSWVLNTEKQDWEPPVPYPTDGESYAWDESAQQWNKV